MDRSEMFEIQDFIKWTSLKIELHQRNSSASKRVLQRGQVYECELGVGVGCEQRKKRPVVIIQNNISNKTSPNTIVAPITHTATNAQITPKYDNGKLILDGYVMTGNIVTVSKARLGDKLCKLTTGEMKIVDDEIIKSQGMKKKFDTLTNIISDKDIYIYKLKEKNTAQEVLIENLKSINDEQNRVIEELKKQTQSVVNIVQPLDKQAEEDAI